MPTAYFMPQRGVDFNPLSFPNSDEEVSPTAVHEFQGGEVEHEHEGGPVVHENE